MTTTINVHPYITKWRPANFPPNQARRSSCNGVNTKEPMTGPIAVPIPPIMGMRANCMEKSSYY